jgi:hypothetical protein
MGLKSPVESRLAVCCDGPAGNRNCKRQQTANDRPGPRCFTRTMAEPGCESGGLTSFQRLSIRDDTQRVLVAHANGRLSVADASEVTPLQLRRSAALADCTASNRLACTIDISPIDFWKWQVAVDPAAKEACRSLRLDSKEAPGAAGEKLTFAQALRWDDADLQAFRARYLQQEFSADSAVTELLPLAHLWKVWGHRCASAMGRHLPITRSIPELIGRALYMSLGALRCQHQRHVYDQLANGKHKRPRSLLDRARITTCWVWGRVGLESEAPAGASRARDVPGITRKP